MNKRILIILIVLISVLNSISCASKKIIIKVNKGANYMHNYKYGLINLKVIPQIAIWAEDKYGNFLKTIYVTDRSAKSNWLGGANISRPSSLPVWSHKRGVKDKNGIYMPTKNSPLPDSETGATPKDSFVREFIVPEDYKADEIIIKLEVNKSFDYNNVYSKDLKKDDIYYNDVNGQPSLIYMVKLKLANNSKNKMELVGCGNPMGSDGIINEDLKFITDARQILDSVEVICE
jgi:hypothetical protein